MENVLIIKYKQLLKKCLDRGISLEIIKQIIYTSQLSHKEIIVDILLDNINEITEEQLKLKISNLIEDYSL